MFLRKRGYSGAQMAVYFLLVVLVAAGVVWFANMAKKNADVEGLRIARDSIRRAAVQCYALEGAYPPSLDYLKAHYGVSPNEELYFIQYQFIAANLMPDITVLFAGGGGGEY